MTQPEMVRASLLAEEAREHHRDVYRVRAIVLPPGTLCHDDVERGAARGCPDCRAELSALRESMRPAGVRKMRQSRKRRKGNMR